LLVGGLIGQHEHTVAQIMKIAGVCRQTVFTYRDKVVSEGGDALLKRSWAGARKPAVHGAVAVEFVAKLEAGAFRQANDSHLLFTPAINQDIHALFLRQIAESDPNSLHVVIQDQAGFHLPKDDEGLPSNIRLLPLPPYCPELNPVEGFGRLLKAPTANRLYDNLRQLEDHLIAVAREWTDPEKVRSLIHGWMRDRANAGALK
jgi:hypothetical protein